MNTEQVKKEICEIGHRLWQLGFVAANDGNISVKIADDRFLITPTGISKSFLTPEMIIEINAAGEVTDGNEKYRPSSEIPMHLRCFQDRPDIGAVVHAHPPVATGFAVAHLPMDDYLMPEAIVHLGSVPLGKFGAPLSEDTKEAVAEYLDEHDAILLRNHGAVTVGEDLVTAYYKMETLEHTAKIALAAKLLGGAKELSREEIEECLEARRKFKLGGRHPGYKKYKK